MSKKAKMMSMVLLLTVICITGLLGDGRTVCAAVAEETREEKFGAGDEWYESGPWVYRILKDGTLDLVEYYGDTSVLEIPAELDGKTVTSFDSWTFYGKHGNKIKTLVIPETITSVLKRSGSYLPRLEEFIVKEENPAYRAENGVLYDKEMKTLVWCPQNKKDFLEIPEGVEELGYCSVSQCSVSEVSLPDSLLKIGWGAFDRCYNITSVVLPGNIEEIESFAFDECTGLKEVRISEGVKALGERMFSDCEKLESIYLPESLVSIEKRAFAYCKSLKEIIIPKQVSRIGQGAFEDCSNLEIIRIPDSVKQIGTKAFSRSKKVVIECSENSYAQKCAQKRGIPYRIINNTSGSKLGLLFNGQGVKNSQTLKVRVNKSYTLQAVRGTEKATAKWNSSNTKVATVKNGKVTVKKAGKTTITATALNGKKVSVTLSASKAAVKVTKVQVTGSKTMKKGNKQILNLTVTPASADNTKVTWKSSNTKVATVDKNGKVTAKKKGAAVITATAKDGSKKKGTIKISVK